MSSSLRHKNIVSYIDHGSHNGIVYLVTEYVSGMDAARLAKSRGGKLNYREVVSIIEQTLAALDFARNSDLSDGHQGAKHPGRWPLSKFSRETNGFWSVQKLKQTGMSGVTMVGDVAGTIAYMPPEQVRDFKEVQPPSDVYAAGMTAYSLLTEFMHWISARRRNFRDRKGHIRKADHSYRFAGSGGADKSFSRDRNGPRKTS